MSGYIAMARRWQEHDLFEGDEFSRRDAWAWLIANAAWKDTTARVNGTSVAITRGELCFSQRFMADKWAWSKSRVDRFMAMLRIEGMIKSRPVAPSEANRKSRQSAGQDAGQKAGQANHIITICNYDKFQLTPDGERGSERGKDRGAARGSERGKEEEKRNNILGAGEPAKKSRLADGWEPEDFGEGSEAAGIITGWPKGEFERQLEQFKDHHRAKGNRFIDWNAAWGTWVRNSVTFARPAATGRRDTNNPHDAGTLVRSILEQRAAAGGAR